MPLPRTPDIPNPNPEPAEKDEDMKQLLSHILAENKGYIKEDLLLAYSAYAAEVFGSKSLSEWDRIWLGDYLEFIAVAKISDAELEKKIHQRSDPRKDEEPSGNKNTDPKSIDPSNQQNPPSQQVVVLTPDRPRRPLPSIPTMVPQPTVLEPLTTTKINELVTRPDVFDGTKSKARGWLDDYDHAVKANNWSGIVAKRYFPTFLSKNARNWYNTMCEPRLTNISTYEDLKEMFLKYYLGSSDKAALRDEIRNTFQKS